MKKSLLLLVLTFFCQKLTAQVYDTNNDVAEVFAGSGLSGYLDAQGTLAMFSYPNQIVADTSSNLFVWDSGNTRVRKITPSGAVSTFVGGGTGSLPGYGTSISLSGFTASSSLVIDDENTIWIACTGPYGGPPGILVVRSDGYTEFLAYGNYTLTGLAIDSQDNIYFGQNNQIFELSYLGILTVVAGSSTTYGSTDGNGIYSLFHSPSPIAVDAAGNVYVWDSGNHLIRRIDQSQNVTTIAGNGSASDADGTGFNAHFANIYAACSDSSGNIFMACGSSIRKLTATTNVVTLAGSFSSSAYANGAGALARFNGASGLCLSQGMIFVADSGNQRIRFISFNPQPQLVTPPYLGVATYAGVTINGLVGRTYQIQSSTDLSTWTTATTLLLTSSPYLWIDPTSTGQQKFYRAYLLP